MAGAPGLAGGTGVPHISPKARQADHCLRVLPLGVVGLLGVYRKTTTFQMSQCWVEREEYISYELPAAEQDTWNSGRGSGSRSPVKSGDVAEATAEF